MKILIVDGWTQDGNEQHLLAGVQTQANTFATLIKENVPDSIVSIVNTHSPESFERLDLSAFQAAVWTGGGGNIYKKILLITTSWPCVKRCWPMYRICGEAVGGCR